MRPRFLLCDRKVKKALAFVLLQKKPAKARWGRITTG